MKNRKIDSIKEIHKLQLELLVFFDKLCRDNGLKYFLAGGTLLGAVKHKGFIPWDDDIDVAMPRDDYNRLIDISKKINGDYKFYFHETENNWMLPFGKLVNKNYSNYRKTFDGKFGIVIDIFPLDGLGNTESEAIKNGKKALFLRRLFDQPFKDNVVSKVLKKIKFDEFVYYKLLRIVGKNNFYHSNYVGSIVGGLRKLDEIFEYRVYSETIDMEFEGRVFKGMKYYDEYLARMYGDYMKLPPKEKQVAEHNVEIYDMRGE